MRSAFLALNQGARAFLLEVWPVASAEDVGLGARSSRMRSSFLALDQGARAFLLEVWPVASAEDVRLGARF